MTTCTTMRSAVLLSLGLLLVGFLLFGLATIIGASHTALIMTAAHAALWLVLGAAAIFGAALAIAIWPGNQARLEECRH